MRINQINSIILSLMEKSYNLMIHYLDEVFVYYVLPMYNTICWWIILFFLLKMKK